MKKILLYLVIAIVVVCCGVSIYYVVRNDEKIYSTQAETQILYLNTEEEIKIPIVHEKPNKKTKIEITSSSDIIEIDTNSWTITAKTAGTARITAISSNKNFGPFEFTISVGNGSVEYPFYIRNEDDLQSIGSEKRSLTSNYQLITDINLTKTFTPIGSTANPFSGTISGAGYIDGVLTSFAINNLVIDERVLEEGKTAEPAGIFRAIGKNGRVENIIVNNANVFANTRYAGIIAGKNYGLIGKCQIYESKIINELTENAFTGIVCGLNETKEDSSSYAGVRLCTIKASIEAKVVAGGITGHNRAGVLTNNNIEIYSAKVEPTNEQKNKALFGGLAGYSDDALGEIKQTIALNNLILIDQLEANIKTAQKGGIFGYISAEENSTRGYYSMLMYKTPAVINPVGKSFNETDILSSSTSARNYAANLTTQELYVKKTYTSIDSSSWDFVSNKNPDGKWLIENDKSISINYVSENLDYQDLPILGTVFEISDSNSLKLALDNMRLYPSAKVTYLIKGESEKENVVGENGEQLVDEDGEPVVKKIEKTYTYKLKTTWEPIGTKEEPFKGSIIADKDATITITGLKANSEYAGLFGVVDANAIISNVNISGAELSGTVVGGIAALQYSGSIRNCTVKNTTITSTKYAGGIVGFSTGTINNSVAKNINISITESGEKNIYLGAITAKSKGTIISSKAQDIKIDINEFEDDSNIVCMGGISGFVENANISSSEVFGLEVQANKYTGKAYAGGLVGYSLSSNFKFCGINVEETASLINLNQENVYALAGGLVGFMNFGKVTNSSVGTITLKGYSSAGIVSFLTGEISSCYAGTTTTIVGRDVGGMTCNLYGKINNSYTLANLEGSEIEAGITTYLWKGSEVDKVFTYCSYLGSGNGYADTVSNYKTRAKDFGSIDNSIFIGNDNQQAAKKEITDFYKEMIVGRDGSKKIEVQITFMFVANKYNYYSENGLLGVQDSYDLFKKMGFNEDIWSFGTEETATGISPILKECYDSEFGQISLKETEENE